MTIVTKIQRTAVILLAFAPVTACAKPVAQAVTPKAQSAVSGVTLQQFQKRQETKMLASDTNGDGRVTKAEFIAAAKPGKRDPAKRFAKLDLNGDGVLDRSEIDAVLARRFKHLDANGDGVASAQERATAHAKGQAASAGSDS